MKTIQFLSKSLKCANTIGIDAIISVGTFKIESYKIWCNKLCIDYKITFQLQFRPDHIQMLLNVGVKIDYNTIVMANLSSNAKRYKSGREAIKQGRYAPYYYMGDPANHQTGVIENWLNATASCDIETLEKLDLICRENHLYQVAIHNDQVLSSAGFIKKPNTYTTPSHITEHRNKIESIRKNVRKITKKAILPYQINCMKKYNF